MLRKKSRFALATCLGAIATVASVAGTSANAQTAKVGTDTQAQATGAAASGGIGDIIVTARRRAERLQDVPVAATAFQREDIQRYATESLTQLATRTPMLSIGQSNGNGGTINLRGIQSPNSGNLIDQAVSINIDGVQISQSNVIRLGQFDLDRIEVLKGPQTLFFGKNANVFWPIRRDVEPVS